jgi:hypothetical protein
MASNPVNLPEKKVTHSMKTSTLLHISAIVVMVINQDLNVLLLSVNLDIMILHNNFVGIRHMTSLTQYTPELNHFIC